MTDKSNVQGGDTPPANYNQRGIEWERPVNMTFFSNEGGDLLFNQDMGIRTMVPGQGPIPPTKA